MPQFDEKGQQEKLAELRREEEERLIEALSQKYGHQYRSLVGVTIDTDALRLIEETEARAAEAAIFEKTRERLSVAIRNPNNPETKKALTGLTERGFTTEIFMVSTASLEHAWKRYEDIKHATASRRGVVDITPEEITRRAESIARVRDIAEELARAAKESGPRTLSSALEVILGGALALHASDVHLEPEEGAVRLRLRLDGVLNDVADMPKDLYRLLSSRLKLLSGLKLNVADSAQDGRFTIDVGEKELEIRTSVIPGGYGETIVMRILDPSTIALSMEKLGIGPELFAALEAELKRPNGMILTTGPTGSGKTTTLYAFLRRIHQPEVKIITLEDPIEYHLEGVVQTQVAEDYTFASGLRAILRQDPDVIMVGEIRDREVAETAINASLTGHLVLSTLHTNNAAGSFPRLIDLGVDARLIGSSVNLTLAQRLVRRLCAECKKTREATPEETRLIHSFLKNTPRLSDEQRPRMLYEAAGCGQCGETGFRGRIGVYEGILVDTAVEEAVIADAREENIFAAAAPQKIPTMQQDGLIKVLAGTTSLAELARSVDLYTMGRGGASEDAAER